MQLPFFYEPNIAATAHHHLLSAETHKHAVQVLRMQIGEAMHITNGLGLLVRAVLTQATKKESIVQIESVQQLPLPVKQHTLAISLLKNASRFEWMLEKATELGITAIVPLKCDRTEKQHFRFDRMQQILVAAMLQSEQVWLPVLHEPISFTARLATVTNEIGFIAHCYAAEKIPLQRCSIPDICTLCIGPEGDFSPEEVSEALAKGYTPVSLGSTRLRTETAGIIGATLLQFA
ncbi:MAG TPA: rRNA methyltransferase [Chitinophagaceae bacterium]|nr:rRNA methyltransferase [Chitinophagaceae bacterium]HAN39382.1 rRNA methyltransferase [Chitinophagaceae bacterium]